VRWLALALALASITCSQGTPSRCDRVCAREAQCADLLELEVDQAECVERCRELEKQSDTSRAVVEHAACVDQAKSCAAVFDCP
jgi:hypothetical protein